MTLVDSHCHLDADVFAGDTGDVIQRARSAGVEHMVAIGTGGGPPDLEAGLRLAEAYPFIYATIGVHPHDASKASAETWENMTALCGRPKMVAIGEIGLDYHYDFSPRDTQRTVFVKQLEIARDSRKPVVIHTREAWEDTLALLREYWQLDLGGIFHCFSEGPNEAQAALELGFHVSFSGIVTYPKAREVQEAARMVPLNRILVETDAPYLAPVPHRGKRNEPAHVLHTARRLAELRGESLEAVAEATTENWRRLCLQAESPGR